MQNSDTFVEPLIIKFNDANAVKQDFSMPSSIIYFIKNYPSKIQTYIKLIKTCKYFYSKKAAVPINGICKMSTRDCIVKPFDRLYPTRALDKIENYWIYGTLCLSIPDTKISKNIFKKVCRSDIICLILEQHPLTFKEFKLLTSSKKLKMFTVAVPIKGSVAATFFYTDCDTAFKYENGDIVTFGTVIEYLPYATYLEYSDPALTKSVENIFEFVKQLNNNVKSHSRWLQNGPSWMKRFFMKSVIEQFRQTEYVINFFNLTLDENAIEFHISKNGLPENFWRRYNNGWHMLVKDRN